MRSYKLTLARTVSTNPLTVEWCGEFVLDDGSAYVPGTIVLSAVPPPDAPPMWVDYTPEARAALAAAAPGDKSAILAAVHLDAKRVLAEAIAAKAATQGEDLLNP